MHGHPALAMRLARALRGRLWMGYVNAIGKEKVDAKAPGAVMRNPSFLFRVILALCHRGRNVLVKFVIVVVMCWSKVVCAMWPLNVLAVAMLFHTGVSLLHLCCSEPVSPC